MTNMFDRAACAVAVVLACCGPEADPTGNGASTLQRGDAYAPCTESAECPGVNALCAAYSLDPDSQFCADFCEHDAACPVRPGFRAICNFAWCAVRCEHGTCPDAMRCIRDQHVLDARGESRGNADICVPSGPIDAGISALQSLRR